MCIAFQELQKLKSNKEKQPTRPPQPQKPTQKPVDKKPVDKIIVAITGASGAIYGITLLKALKSLNIETHLIISKAARITIKEETNFSSLDILKLTDFCYKVDDIAAKISSGSFKTSGMIIMPCSVKTAAEIASGVTTNLISRAADVVLKERRKLVLCLRETPLNLIHLRNMTQLAEAGAIIAPIMPAFYNKPKTIQDIVDHNVGRVIDLFDLDSNLVKRWRS